MLGAVYEVTKAPRAKQEENAKQKSYKTVFKDADKFESYELDEKNVEKYLKDNGITPAQAYINEVVTAVDKNNEAFELAERFALRVTLSVKSGAGCEELEKLVNRLFIDGELDTERDAVISSARQHDALVRVIDALTEALSSLNDGFPPDVAGVCLEDAAARLCELDGRGHGAVGADIADGIFSRFCVGK
jgi:tRNA U34 5-carboxymethylaminomethyl modifying GTPase MnmE/TrmE